MGDLSKMPHIFRAMPDEMAKPGTTNPLSPAWRSPEYRFECTLCGVSFLDNGQLCLQQILHVLEHMLVRLRLDDTIGRAGWGVDLSGCSSGDLGGNV